MRHKRLSSSASTVVPPLLEGAGHGISLRVAQAQGCPRVALLHTFCTHALWDRTGALLAPASNN